MGVHATLTPLNTTESNPLLTLKFDSPKTAKAIKVQLFEMDENMEGEGGEDDIIAIFEGEIKDRKFKGRLIREVSTPRSAPSFRFKFEGETQEHTLRIPSGRGEDEKGAYEIGVKITRHENMTSKARTTDAYVSPAPAFVRNLPESKRIAEHRPIVVFLANQGDKFYDGARKFWQPVADRLEVRKSLQSVIDFLNVNSSSETKDGMELGKWGQVNIVTHATEQGWAAIGLLAKDDPPEVNARMIEEKLHDLRLALTTDKVDDKLAVVFRGCNVGRVERFLRASRQLFGGKCSVCAPKFAQYYGFQWGKTKPDRVRVTQAWEYFEEDFNYFVPWPTPVRGKKSKVWARPKLPKAKAIIRRLQAKYPDKADEKEWAALVEKKRHDSTIPKWLPFPLVLEDKSLLKNYKRIASERVKNITEDEDGDPVNPSEYSWKIKKPKEQKDGSYLVECLGSTYRIEVRRLLRDAEGNIAVPKLANRDHYGRVP